MTKEETLKLITGLILELKDRRKFIDAPELIDDWKRRHTELQVAINSLNPHDLLWLSEKYAIWFRQEFGDRKKLQKILQAIAR